MVGAVFTKQQHGACNTFLFAKGNDLRVAPTGGVPRWPYRVDMYQTNNRFVAISTSTSIELTICQKVIFAPAFHLGSNHGYF
jgi:hypothetical protein